nr:MAG: RNA-dependent RNA polymerase [Botourmiaviridae sp.]
MFSKNIQKKNKKVTESYEKSVRCSRDNLRELVSMINTFYDVDLPPVPLSEDIKEFCVGLIENPDAHPWKEMWKTLPARKRWGIAHSLFLFRKTLPSSQTPEEAVAAAMARLGQDSRPVDEGFLAFIRKEIPKIFKRGWDAKYSRFVSSLTLSTSSCNEVSRKKGGSRVLNRQEFDLRSRILNNDYLPCDSGANLSAVNDGGKLRVVTSNPVAHQALGPLHHVIYEHLSRQKWLLRGDAKPCRFKGFFTKPGERFCSGDYEAATDNIPFAVYREMLLAVEDCSDHIGSSVWSLAFRQVCRELRTPSRTLFARRGQLMGSFLSFPFLCLLNYLIFRYTVGGGPVLINGDDIVFRASPGKIKKWMEGVNDCGLVLSKGKTLVDDSVFTLNSAIFRAYDRHVKAIPFIRSKAFFGKPESLDALKGRYHAFLIGGSAIARMHLKAKFLRKYASLIHRSKRSLSRCMGWKVSKPILKLAGLFKREKFYLSLDREEPLPVIREKWSGLPKDWVQWKLKLIDRKRRKDLLEDEKRYHGGDLVEHSWVAVVGKEPPKGLLWARMGFRALNYYQPRKCGIMNTKLYKSIQSLVVHPKITVGKTERKVWVWYGFGNQRTL